MLNLRQLRFDLLPHQNITAVFCISTISLLLPSALDCGLALLNFGLPGVTASPVLVRAVQHDSGAQHQHHRRTADPGRGHLPERVHGCTSATAWR